MTAYGAPGGGARDNPQSYRPGRGAVVTGVFQFSKGEQLSVVVGQPGDYRDGTSCCTMGGAGGGGTFLWKTSSDAEPLIVAGGGGGAAYGSSSNQYWGGPGMANTKGGYGSRGSNSPGSNGGGGPRGGGSYPGGGGGGWKGQTSCSNCGYGKPGGFLGGSPQRSGYDYEGGFGGGGGGYYEGGAGGGYSGGGGGTYSHNGGGGGGSYLHSAAKLGEMAAGGNQLPVGFVVLEKLKTDNPDELVVTTCGAVGRTGPDTTMCNNHYNLLQNTMFKFLGTTNGIQVGYLAAGAGGESSLMSANCGILFPRSCTVAHD